MTEPHTPPAPLPVDRINPDALYNTFRRLLRVSELVIRDVARNSADLHQHSARLAEIVQEGENLLYPPPLPDAPDDAVVKFPHALRVGDVVRVENEWLTVTRREIPMPPQVGFLVWFAEYTNRMAFAADHPLVVIPAPTPKETTA